MPHAILRSLRHACSIVLHLGCLALTVGLDCAMKASCGISLSDLCLVMLRRWYHGPCTAISQNSGGLEEVAYKDRARPPPPWVESEASHARHITCHWRGSPENLPLLRRWCPYLLPHLSPSWHLVGSGVCPSRMAPSPVGGVHWWVRWPFLIVVCRPSDSEGGGGGAGTPTPAPHPQLCRVGQWNSAPACHYPV